MADRAARADLIALYAFDREITRAPQVASNPLVGEIRLAWWREAVEEVFAGGTVRRHPVVEALKLMRGRSDLSREGLLAAIDARHDDLSPAPFADEAALNGYLDAAYGSIMVEAARRLEPDADPSAVHNAARAWGMARLDPRRLPDAWSGAGLLDAAAVESARLRTGAFPAVVHVALLRVHHAGPLARRWRLWRAVLAGRL